MIVDFDTTLWNDKWVRKLSFTAKGLFVYLWTNESKNLLALYQTNVEKMAFDTGLTVAQVKKALEELSPKVLYDPEEELIFVVNHFKRQFMRTPNISPTIKSSVLKVLLSLPEGHCFIKVFLEKYQILNIPYPYPIDTPSVGYQYPTGEGEGGGEGEGKGDARGKPVDNSAAPLPPSPLAGEGRGGGVRRPLKKAPAGFEPTADMLSWAVVHGLPSDVVATETAKFRDHEFATAKTDWPAAWRNWIRKAVEQRFPMTGPARAAPSAGRPPHCQGKICGDYAAPYDERQRHWCEVECKKNSEKKEEPAHV